MAVVPAQGSVDFLYDHPVFERRPKAAPAARWPARAPAAPGPERNVNPHNDPPNGGGRPAAQGAAPGADRDAAAAGSATAPRSGRAGPVDDRCPRCGAGFHCGVNDPTPCPCTGVRLDARQLVALRVRYDRCLCLRCLQALAGGAAVEPPAAGD